MILPEEVLKRVKYWASSVQFDLSDRTEVKRLLRDKSYEELMDRFYKNLEFGTGGLRGLVGVGSCRMNFYNIRRATTALALCLNKDYKLGPLRVAISYDSRLHSKSFACAAAEVLAANGIKALITKHIRPTPVLSFMVRYFHCQAGICITASHNPSGYNGYKVYNEVGGQIVPPQDKKIIDAYNSFDRDFVFKYMPYEEALSKELIQVVGGELDEAYLQKITELPFVVRKDKRKLKVVYSPLHGAGYYILPEALKRLGYHNIYIVPEQAVPDGNFPTIESPNPENLETLTLSFKYADKKNADLVLVTDPDADRIALAFKEKGVWKRLNGNQMACLLTNFILFSLKQKRGLCLQDFVAKTIVTTELLDRIATSYGVSCKETLTGFKWIAELVNKCDLIDHTQKNTFICGGEESYGFLAGDFVRDKDATIAAVAVCEMVEHYRTRGLGLLGALDELFLCHGVFYESLTDRRFEGHRGGFQIKKIMNSFREKVCLGVFIKKVNYMLDYSDKKKSCFIKGETSSFDCDLPQENTLKFFLKNKATITLRPSGTESKLKIYFSIQKKAPTTCNDLEKVKKEVLQELKALELEVDCLLGQFIN